MTIAKLNLFKTLFQRTLTGKWSSVEGTFMMQSDTFEFYEDGTGQWIYSSGMGEEITQFRWKSKAPFVIELLEEGDDWITINYDFKIIQNDISEEVILCEKDSDTFYFALTKIGYCGKTD